MINPHPPLSLEKKKKIVLFAIIPVCLLFISALIYFQISHAGLPIKKNIQRSTVPVPDRPRQDTMASNKSDLYAILDGTQKKEDEGKAVFNANDKLNLDNTVAKQPSPEVKLTMESKPPAFLAPKFYRQPESSVKRLESSKIIDENSSSFNSIVVSHDERKTAEFGQISKQVISDDINCPAIVTSKTRIKDGGSITFQTLDDITIGGKTIPMGTAVTGSARINANRISIRINSMNLDNKIVFVRLTAYDEDGQEGLKVQGIPGIKNGTRETVDEQINSVGQEAESQISGLGGRFVDGMIRNITRTGNLRKDEVTVPAGYKLILKSN